jgi:catalase-peroxidase
MGDHTITSASKAPGRPNPIQWDDDYFRMLMDYDYELVKSPAGRWQWQPIRPAGGHGARPRTPRAARADHDVDRRHRAQGHPEFRPISEKFRSDPAAFATPGRAPGSSSPTATWGPKSRYLGPKCRRGSALAGPDPGASARDRRAMSLARSKDHRLRPDHGELVQTAWASASTFRGSDKRGGANGGRIRSSRSATGR